MDDTSERNDGFAQHPQITPPGERSARLVAIEPVVRRVIAVRVEAGAVDDLVQETLMRLARAAGRLDGADLDAYAAVAARNAATDHHRTRRKERESQHRVADLRQPPAPDGEAIARDEALSLQAALDSLDPADQRLLEAHHIEEVGLTELARRDGRTEMATRLRLSKARARLRVRYALAHRRTPLPTSDCEPVLHALATGDRRAQLRVNAEAHLRSCECCRDHAPVVTGDERPVVALVAGVWAAWRARPRGQQAVSLVAASAVTVGTAVGLTATDNPEPPSEPRVAAAQVEAPPKRIAGTVLTDAGPLRAEPAALQDQAGKAVLVNRGAVSSVPADEGFWLKTDDGDQVWVVITATKGESAVHVQPGNAVTFAGRLVRTGRLVPSTAPASATERAFLQQQGHHIEVAASAIEVSR